jgi:hypothetical protein
MTVTRKKRVPIWYDTFLHVYSQTGNVAASCRAAGITVQAFYKNYNTDDEFAARAEEAKEQSIAILELDLRKRAGSSDVLLMFLLKSLRPDVYRERHEIQTKVMHDYIIDISRPQDTNNHTPSGDGTTRAILE